LRRLGVAGVSLSCNLCAVCGIVKSSAAGGDMAGGSSAASRTGLAEINNGAGEALGSLVAVAGLGAFRRLK